MISKKLKKNIYILGLGVSGMSLAQALKKTSCNTICWDDDIIIRKKAKKNKIEISSVEETNFEKLDYLVLSPGIKSQGENSHIAANKAKKYAVKIISDLEFLSYLEKKKTLIGITGTNGKSTTTVFTKNLISFKRKSKSQMCGNIGIPLDKIDLNKYLGPLVVEISSFQLDRIQNLKFEIAVLLNISKDHIDWHENMSSYIKAKLNIFKNQTQSSIAIICIDNKICEKIANEFKMNFKSRLITISTDFKKKSDINFRENKYEIEIINNLINKKILIKKDKIRFTIAKHNFQNLIASYTVYFALGLNHTNFSQAVEKLKNVEHRIEFIGSKKNINFFNDSKSTNIDSVLTALDSLENNLLIIGGREKHGGLKGIERKKNKIIKAYTFGEAKKNFHNYLRKNSIKSAFFSNLETAFNSAVKDALKLKIKVNILFSPACSSYDQFKNFSERGKYFKNLFYKKIK